MIKSYRDLKVRQKAMDLVVMCYQMTRKFPKNEILGLAGQLQRAAVSVPSNIAEGHQRWHRKEFLHHLSIAYASLAELETHAEIASRLNYIDQNDASTVLNQAAEIGMMINGLRKSIGKKPLIVKPGL
jgi:four helix bundle protein